MGLTFRLGQIPLGVFTDTSNNVGIGAAPSGTYKFQVTGASASNDAYVQGDGAYTGGALFIKQYAAGVTNIIGYNLISSQTSGHYFSSSISGGFKNFLLDPTSLTTGTTRSYILPDASGTLALTSNLSGYLPLTGGTLTGALGGTSASFSGTIQTSSATTGGSVKFNYGANAVSRSYIIVSDAYNYGDLGFQQSTTQTGSTYSNKMILAANGDLTIGSVPSTGVGNLYAGAATFSSSVTLQGMTNGDGTADTRIVTRPNTPYALGLQNSTTSNIYYLGVTSSAATANFQIYNTYSAASIFSMTYQGAATFSSSVTATQGIFKNSGVPAILAYRDLDVTVVGAAGQGIEFGARNGATTFVSGAAIYGVLDNPATTGSMVFQTLTAGSLTTKLTITSTGAATFTAATQDAIQTVVRMSGNNASGQLKTLDFKLTAGTPLWTISTAAVGTDAGINIMPNGSAGLSLAYAGAATFSSSVTAKTVGDYRQATLGTNTGAALYITNNNNAGYGLLIGNSFSYGESWIQAGRVDGTATAYNLTLQAAGGNVIIGATTDSGEKFQVQGALLSKGSTSILFFQNRASTNYFGLYGTNDIYFYNTNIGNISTVNATTGVYTALSDINKKKDFEQSKLGLNAILGLNPTLYRMKEEENTEKHLGFIAQEVKEFIPQAFVESGDFIGLDYQAITATLVKAVQELKTEIDILKNK